MLHNLLIPFQNKYTLFLETDVSEGSAVFFRRNDARIHETLFEAERTRLIGRLGLTYINQEIRVREEPDGEPLILYQDPNPREVWSVVIQLIGESVWQIYEPCF